MSHRTIISVVAGIACVATVSTDAFAYRGGRVGVGRVGVHHVYHAPVRRGVRAGVAIGVGAAAAGAYGAPARCGYYPYPACY
jgi:hypothetical protein